MSVAGRAIPNVAICKSEMFIAQDNLRIISVYTMFLFFFFFDRINIDKRVM